jgi:hypothetical protein
MQWKPVSTPQMAAASVAFAILCYLIKTDHALYHLIDKANWPFHEFGHVFFRILADTASLYGGTLMQLIVPLVCAAAFIRQEEPVGTAVCGVWFFENFLYIAWYMSTNRDDFPLLPEGLEHDFDLIFARWGAQSLQMQVAGITRTIGWLGIAAVWIWLLVRWRNTRVTTHDSRFTSSNVPGG